MAMPIKAALAALLLLVPIPVLAAGGGHGGPTPTCRKGCKPLSPAQVEQLRQRPNERPSQIGGVPLQ